MLDGFRQHLNDRRGKYSLRKHIGRLRREGRLSQVGLAVVAILTLGGVAFAKCQASGVTGPSEEGSVTPSSLLLGPSETVQENTVERDVVFVGVNPCNGDVVRAFGKRHDKLRAKVEASGASVTLDHHINDSFRGEAVKDPNQKYTGSDVHTDRFEMGPDGTEHREFTNEHLISAGPAPNWILHIHQRYEFRFAEPLSPTVTMEGHASCPPTSECLVEGGCVDREMIPESVTP